MCDHAPGLIETDRGRLEGVRIGPFLKDGSLRHAIVAGRLIEREHKVKKGTRRLVAILTVVSALALAPAAFAQSTGTGYAGEPSGVAGQTAQGGTNGSTNNNGTPATASQVSEGSGSGSLPFTGLDLVLLAGGGLVLLGTGAALSRLVGRHSAS